MPRKKLDGQTGYGEAPPTSEMFTPGGDFGLNGAISAAEGEQGEATSDTVAETPKVQPAGNFPTAEDAYADMSLPPPSEPIEYAALNHGASVPQDAFRAIAQDKYISLHMFN